jgi:hypothetical protein
MKGVCETICLRRMISNMKMQWIENTPLFCDKQGVLKLDKNTIFHEKTKHVEIHFHFIRKFVEVGSIQPQHCPIEDQNVNIFT